MYILTHPRLLRHDAICFFLAPSTGGQRKSLRDIQSRVAVSDTGTTDARRSDGVEESILGFCGECWVTHLV